MANHGVEAIGVFDSIEKSIKAVNQSVLFLFKTSSASCKSEILGIFY